MNENHQHEFPDELLSAYLDGELSPAEKVRVEEQLMDSPEHRRLFEELKSLRRSLQSLPAEALDDEFAARVLRRAERELLADAASANDAAANATAANEPAADNGLAVRPRGVSRDRGAWRGLAWSIVATAAAVGLVVFGPLFNESSRNVSLRDAQTPEMRAAPDAQPAEEHLADEAAHKVAENAAVSIASDGDAQSARPSDFRAAENSFSKPGAVAPSIEMPAESAEDSTTLPERALKRQRADGAFGGGGAGSDNARGGRPQGDALGGLAGDKDRAERQNRQSANEKAGQSATVDDVVMLSQAQSAADGLHQQGLDGAPEAFRAARGQLQATHGTPRVALVTVDVRRESLAGGFFDKALQRHNILVESTEQPAAKPLAEGLAQFGEAAPADNAIAASGSAEPRDAATEDVAAGEGSGAGASITSLRKQNDAAMHEDVEVMYVVASRAQIASLLLELESQSADVLAMAYDDGAAKKYAQKNWAEPAGRFEDSAGGKELDDAKLAASSQVKDEVAPFAAEPPEGELAPEPPSASVPKPTVTKADLEGLRGPDTNPVVPGGAKGKAGVARRLALPLGDESKAEEKLHRANGLGKLVPAPVREADADSVAADAGPRDLQASADAISEEDVPAIEAEAVELADDELGPAAPPANGSGESRLKSTKVEEQELVHVLFVLRAVARPNPASLEAEVQPAKE